MWIVITLSIIFILLYSNIVCYISYNEDTKIIVRYLFIVIKIPLNVKDKSAPDEEQEDKKETKASKKSTVGKKKKRKETQTKEKKFSTFIENAKLILAIVKDIYPLIYKSILKFRITNININIAIFDTNAAQTAIIYGQAMAILNSIHSLILKISILKFKQVRIVPNFITDESYIDISLRVKVRLYQLISMLVTIIIKIIKSYLKNQAKEKEGV